MRRIDYSNTQRCKERERRVQGDRQGLPATAGRECVGETLAVSLHLTGKAQYAVAGRPPGSPLHVGCYNIRSLQATVLLCVLASLFCLPLTAVAHTRHVRANTGHITGRLLDATKNNAPLADQRVTLQQVQGANSQDAATVTTDVQGNYSFTNLATDKTVSYAVYIRYQGAQYISDVVTLDSKPEQHTDLTVYDATLSTAKIAIIQSTVLIHQPDAQKGVMSISEIFSFQNIGAQTYVGSFDTSKGKPNALRFSLPANAKNVTLGKGFDGYHTLQVDLGFATDAALQPGITQFSFAYVIPYTSSAYDFRFVNVYPTLALSLLVPPSLQVDPGFMTSAGITNSGDHPYRLYKSTALIANDEIHINLAGLPMQRNANTGSPLNMNLVWFIAGLFVLLAVIIVANFIYGFNQRKKVGITSKKGKRGTGKGRHAPVTAKNTKEAPATTQKDKKEALLQELLALDKAYESGKLSKAVYSERRAKTKARLRSLMSEQEVVRR